MAGGMMTPDDFGLPGGGTNGGNVPLLTPPVYTTNDLWLQMDGITNTTAYLTIHPPWTVTNSVYDLYYTTNLTAPATWSWVLRSFAGLTNLTVNNATDAQGFYRLVPINDPIGNSSQGTNFWVAFCNMIPDSGSDPDYGYHPPPPTNMSLYISSPVGASGTVTYFTNVFIGQWTTNTVTTNFTVAAGAVTNVSIPSGIMFDSGYDDNSDSTFTYRGIHVTASQPVSVYGMNYASADSVAFTGYPTTLLGTNYCLMAHPSYFNAYGQPEFAIVATEDNTTVIVTPSSTADIGGGNLVSTNILQQGQTYENKSVEQNSVDDDLTGTWIKSDKPIAVFAGVNIALVPDENTQAGNPLVQEQLPVESWGTMALGLSFAGRTNGDSYRVLAAYSNTVVTITGTVVTITNEPINGLWQVSKTNEMVVTNLDAGQFCDFIIDGPAEFQASQPIQLAQFANGAFFDHDNNPNAKTDPCEILLPPTGHYLETNIVFTPFYNTNSTGDFVENYLNLIVAQSAITNTFVDTNLVAATNFAAIGSSGYYGARLSVTNGTHTVTSSRPVGVEVYGFGLIDAYGYFGGVVK